MGTPVSRRGHGITLFACPSLIKVKVPPRYPHMIPRVRQQTFAAGTLTLTLSSLVGVSIDGSEAFRELAASVAQLLQRDFEALGGSLRTLGPSDSAEGPVLRLVEDRSVPHSEGYLCDVSQSGVIVRARGAAGLFYGTRTVLVAYGSIGTLGYGSIVDEPRYVWRGAHLDVARHYYPVQFVKRFIDLLALHKMNVFHWHLTEDQGWRIQIDSFPKLTEVSAWRGPGSEPYGGYYTKDEVREVVRYASERFITVVPEIEMPGHAVAALAAYPELSCTGGPFEVETRWGIFDDVYCVGQDHTLDFLGRVIDEVLELFPGPYFHIGGDECPKERWRNCPACQARMKSEGLSTEEELQSWFVRRTSRYLEARGQRLVGWDEILEGGLAAGATVMSWRGTSAGVRAAQMGHDVVMSPTSHCYLDYKQTSDDEEPGAWFAPALELRTVYGYEPTPTELTPEQAAHVLGVQANIWTERMPTESQVEYMAFPRLCALSEVAWSGPERDFDGFLERLVSHEKLLDRLGVGYRGSKLAQPVRPSAEEKAQFLRAQAERTARCGSEVGAYS